MKQHLMFVHAIGGCDTVSALYMKGKMIALEVLRSCGDHDSLSRFRFRFIYLVILQTQETSAKTKSGRCRRGHLEKNKVYNIHVCTNNSNY